MLSEFNPIFSTNFFCVYMKSTLVKLKISFNFLTFLFSLRCISGNKPKSVFFFNSKVS